MLKWDLNSFLKSHLPFAISPSSGDIVRQSFDFFLIIESPLVIILKTEVIVTSLHDVMHSYAILDYIISLVNEMKFIHLYLFNYVNIDGN